MKTITLLMISLLYLGTSTFAQHHKSGCNYNFSKFGKFGMQLTGEAYFMPTVGFGTAFPNGHVLIGEGIGFGIQTSKRVALTFHLQHSYTSQKFKNYLPPGTVIVDESFLTLFPDLTIKGHMVEGGLRLRYYIGPFANARLLLYPQVGLFIANDKSKYVYIDNDGIDVTPTYQAGKMWRNSHTFVDLGFGIEKPISYRFGAFLELNCRFKTDDNTLLHIYDQGISVHGGVRVRL